MVVVVVSGAEVVVEMEVWCRVVDELWWWWCFDELRIAEVRVQ